MVTVFFDLLSSYSHRFTDYIISIIITLMYVL